MKRIVLLAGIAVFFIALLVWRSLPNQVLVRHTHAVVDLIDMGKPSGLGIMDMRAMGKLVAEEIDIVTDFMDDEVTTATRGQVEMGYRWIAENAVRSDFKLDEIKDIRIDGDSASVKTRITARLELKDIRMLDGAYAAEFIWRKDDKGDWRLAELVWR